MDNDFYFVLGSPFSTVWSDHMTSYQDGLSLEDCASQCSVIINGCNIFVKDGARCHFGDVLNSMSGAPPLMGSVWDVYIKKGLDLRY